MKTSNNHPLLSVAAGQSYAQSEQTMPFEDPKREQEETTPIVPRRKQSVEEDEGYWPDPERKDQEPLRDDL